MKKVTEFHYTLAHKAVADGTVSFECSLDHDHWPWLALAPSDPIVVQSINYWAAVETSVARGSLDPTKWTALTQMEWTYGEGCAGHAVTGVSELVGPVGEPGYRLRLFDSCGASVLDINGTGVVFSTRDFESWRTEAKEKVAVSPSFSSVDFHFAPPFAVGMKVARDCFLSPLNQSNPPCAQALITKESGFPPVHPYHSGSGDHVNSTHLADVARQFAALLNPDKSIAIKGGQMKFLRFVELDYPFGVELKRQDSSSGSITMEISQAGHHCADITLRLGSI